MKKKCSSNSTSTVAQLQATPGRAGADTVAFYWNFEPGQLADLEASLVQGEETDQIGIRAIHDRNPRLDCHPGFRGSVATNGKVLGHSVFINFKNRTIKTEGRAAPVLSEWKDDPRLLPLPYLSEVSEKLESRLALELGISELLFSEPRVARLDIAADATFDQSLHGRAFLRGLGGLTAGSRKTVMYWKAGQIETVALHRGVKKLGKLAGRFYDKGLEQGNAPGERIRAEVQKLFEKQQRPRVETVASWSAADFWKKELRPWLKIGNTLKAVPVQLAAEYVIRAAEENKVSWQEAERLIAALSIASLRGWNWWAEQGHEGSGRARKKSLEQLGVLVAPVSVPVDLSGGLDAFRSSFDNSSELEPFPSKSWEQDPGTYMDETSSSARL